MESEELFNPELSESLKAEFYIQSDILKGQLACPLGFRLLDLFNNTEMVDDTSPGEFIEFVNEINCTSGGSYFDAPKEYIRRTSVHLVAVPDLETGRGLGSTNSLKTYPFICKLPRLVKIEMQYYSLVGTAYLRQEQTMRELLNEQTQFLPLTDVTITHEGHLKGARPFAIINKQWVISIKEQPLNKIKDVDPKTAVAK
jgi:hypothetical protein